MHPTQPDVLVQEQARAAVAFHIEEKDALYDEMVVLVEEHHTAQLSCDALQAGSRAAMLYF